MSYQKLFGNWGDVTHLILGYVGSFATDVLRICGLQPGSLITKSPENGWLVPTIVTM